MKAALLVVRECECWGERRGGTISEERHWEIIPPTTYEPLNNTCSHRVMRRATTHKDVFNTFGSGLCLYCN